MRTIIWIAGLCLATSFTTNVALADCPAHSHPISVVDQGNVIKTQCRCDQGYSRQGNQCVVVQNPTVPNLAIDPTAACQSASQLRVVDGRIGNLKKAVALLGDSNPEWTRERDRVLDDMHEDRKGLAIEGVNLLTLGLAEWGKIVAKSRVSGKHVEAAFAAFRGPMANLPGEEARLNRVLATTKDPEVTKAILNYTTALHRLRDAEYSKDVVDMAARTREAGEKLHTEFEILGAKPSLSRDAANDLYWSSAFVGSAAIIFVAEGPEAIAAAAGSAGASVLVGGRELVNLWKEYGQLAALDQDASKRNQMKVELNRRLNDLLDQRGRIVAVVQRSGPATNCLR